MSDGKPLKRVLSGVALCGLLAVVSGCSVENTPILSPAGPIAHTERDILFRAFAIMMIVVIPVFVMTFLFAWRYRASNTRARYDRNWMSNKVDAIVWIVPALIVISVGVHVWIYTHSLDPYKPLDSSVKPLRVQVVAEDWKWLFIYPDQDVASVNELAFPSGTPLSLQITSDTVMNSFFIPALGGQIYAMAGMRTRLHLLADAPGRFVGRNTQYSGNGFADQHFAAVAMSATDFDAWLAKARQSSRALDGTAYEELAKPSKDVPVTYYSSVAANLFDGIIAKYTGTTKTMTAAAR